MLDLKLMQSIEEHQDIPTGGVAVMQVGKPRKRRRVCNLTAERRQKRKERIWRNCESKKKLAAACRKVSGRAKVAWRKRKPFRNVRALEKCGRRKEFVAGIRTTLCAKVAWHKDAVMKDRRSNKDDARSRPGINSQV
jgi:hypothetical protein